MLKLVVIVMVPFTHGEERHEPRIARGTFGGIGLRTEDVAGAVDQKCAVLQYNDSRNSGNQERTERANPSIPQSAGDCGKNKADDDSDELDVAMLPAHKLVFQQIGNVIVGWIAI